MISMANMLLSDLKKWVDYNCLKMNTNKTKAMILALINKPLIISCKLLYNQEFEFVGSIKSLGALFSPRFKME